MKNSREITKREYYSGKKFTSRTSLVNMIESYIVYYTNKQLQKSRNFNSDEKCKQYMLTT